jgi:hypothetical protein
MLLKFGGFSHAVAEVDVSTQAESLFTSGGTPWATRKRWTITGDLLAANSAGIDAAAASLLAAYPAGETGDFSLTLPAGGNAVAVSALSADALGGIKVTRPPSFPGMANSGYVTTLPFSIELEGTFPLASVATALLSFTESLVFEGGGPLIAHLELVSGLPRAQRVKDSTIYRATQSGQAVGIYTWPTRPGPRWPASLVRSPRRELVSPRRDGDEYTEFVISWAYEFESADPLFGTPNAWGT